MKLNFTGLGIIMFVVLIMFMMIFSGGVDCYEDREYLGILDDIEVSAGGFGSSNQYMLSINDTKYIVSSSQISGEKETGKIVYVSESCSRIIIFEERFYYLEEKK